MADRRKPARKPRLERDMARFLLTLDVNGTMLTRQDAVYDAPGRGPVPATLVDKALALGLVRFSGTFCVPTPQARSFLTRRKAGEEGFLVQHRTMGMRRLSDGSQVRIDRNAELFSHFMRLKGRDGRPYFGADALRAAFRFVGDMRQSGMVPHVTMRYQHRLEQRPSGRRARVADMPFAAATATDRVRGALAALGPELSGVVFDVLCFDKGLEDVELARDWPARSAKLMLRTALLALHRHYGMSDGAMPDPVDCLDQA